VSRLFFERVAHGLCRHTLTGVGGATIMDLMEAHAVGKTGAFVKYQPLLTRWVHKPNHQTLDLQVIDPQRLSRRG
jgi:hypothetical protein